MATEEEQVKAFLRQYLECEREIEVRAEELARCRCLAVKTTGAIGGERVQGSRKNRLEETIERIVELEEALLEQVERLRGTKEAVDRAIAAVDSGRFCRCDTWRERIGRRPATRWGTACATPPACTIWR